MMTRNSHIWALSAATTVALLQIVYAIIIFVAPKAVMDFIMRANYVVPSSVPLEFQFNMMDAALGLVAHFVVTYLLVLFFFEVHHFIKENY